MYLELEQLQKLIKLIDKIDMDRLDRLVETLEKIGDLKVITDRDVLDAFTTSAYLLIEREARTNADPS